MLWPVLLGAWQGWGHKSSHGEAVLGEDAWLPSVCGGGRDVHRLFHAVFRKATCG